jgi:hypothetical protein
VPVTSVAYAEDRLWAYAVSREAGLYSTLVPVTDRLQSARVVESVG